MLRHEDEDLDGEELDDNDKEDRESQRSFGQLGQNLLGSTSGSEAVPGTHKTPPKPKKEEKRKCGLCKNLRLIAEWPVHCPHCRPCKQAIDNLSYAAKAQGQEDWWKQQRKDEASLRAVIKKYQEQCPVATEKGKNRGTFNLVKYIEEFKAKTAVINNDVGEMMCRSRYIAFAQTYHNPEGILTDKQAETRWSEMEAAASNGEWLHDKNGPEKEQLQLRIRTASQVIFQDEFSHAKVQQSQQQKDLKKASLADVEAGRRSLLRDHERGGLGKDGEHKDFGGIAQAMLQTAQPSTGARRDSAFAGSGVFLPNMQSMQDELAEDEAEKKAKADSKKQKKNNASAGSAADEEEDEDAEDPEPQRPKSNWFDEGFVNRAKRAQETQQSKCEDSVNKTLQTAVRQLLESHQTAHNNPVREKETLKSRLKFLLHVAGYDEVDDWSSVSIDLFSSAPVASEEQQVQRLKQAIQTCNEARPPCENYKQLEPLQIIKDSLTRGFQDLLDKARSKEEVIVFVKAIQSRRQPIAKLCQAVNKATKDLKAIFNSKKRVAQQAPDSTTGSQPSKKSRVSGTTPVATPKGAAKTSMPLFAAAQTHATKINVVHVAGPENEAPDQPLDLAVPVLFTAGTWKAFETEAALSTAVQSFVTLWKASDVRTTQKKASQKLVGSSETLVNGFLTKPLEKWLQAVPSDDSFKDLRGSLQPTVFASCAGTETVYIEKDACPCVRLTIQGIREVVMAPLASWAKVGLAGQTSSAGKGMIQRVCGSFMHAAPSVVQAGHDHVYFATVGPSDLLYTPAGWIVAEKVQQTASKTADVPLLHVRRDIDFC